MPPEPIPQNEAEATPALGAPQEDAPVGQEQANAGAVDKDAEIARLTGELESSNQRYKSLQGAQQVRVSGPDMVAAQLETKAELRRMRRDLLDVQELTPEDRRTATLKIEAEERQDQQVARERQQATDFETRSQRMITRMQNSLTRAGLSMDNPKVAELAQRFNAATTLEERDDIHDELRDFAQELRENAALSRATTAEKDAEETRKRASIAEGVMLGGVGRGAPSGVATATRENIDGLYVQWDREHPNAKNPYEDKYRTFVKTGEF